MHAWFAAAAFAACGSLAAAAKDPSADDLERGMLFNPENTFTEETLRQLHSKLDENSDGKVSLQEILRHTESVGRQLAFKDVTNVLNEIDTSGDRKLSLEEHITDLHHQVDGASSPGDIEELGLRKRLEAAKFEAADEDGNRLLDHAEVVSLLYPETHDGVLAVTVDDTMRIRDLNGDGFLNMYEFWEVPQDTDGPEGDLAEEERRDFADLDTDHDGLLSHKELGEWESGRFHVASTMRSLIRHADQDADLHLTAEELVAARDHVASSDAQYHFIEWAEHHEL